MILTVTAPVVPGRMDDKEREQFMVEARTALNTVGYTKRSLNTPGDNAQTVIFESPAIRRNSQVDVRIFVNGFLPASPAFSCLFEKRANYARGTGAAVLVTAATVVTYAPFLQSADLALTADGTITVTVDDNGCGPTDWTCWVEIRT